jgi:hypothetical protein
LKTLSNFFLATPAADEQPMKASEPEFWARASALQSESARIEVAGALVKTCNRSWR